MELICRQESNENCWYLDFFIIFDLLVVEMYILFLFKKEKGQGSDIWYCSFS